DYERLFAQLQSEGKSVDAVVYVSTGEDDYGHIHTLLQGLHSLTKRPSQLLLVGIAQTALSGCAQESWIGYARSLSMSLARVSCRVLLLSEPEAVITEELGHRGSSVVRYRAGERSVPSVRHVDEAQVSQGEAVSIEAGETYLITGGLGGLGQLFAHYLASQAKVNLILTGRRAIEQAEPLLAQLRAKGS
ncbi:KR domain-containing protein, partial [Pseudoalteromonas holothuriae]|uniref:KR domain-containing protein n=1 Tax=Pseudoalteromonas holothuriae TaxID=2963714 RepID=UPI0021C11DAF